MIDEFDIQGTTTTTTTTTNATTAAAPTKSSFSSAGSSRRLLAAALNDYNKKREAQARSANIFAEMCACDTEESATEELYECEICHFRGSFDAVIACESSHSACQPERVPPVHHKPAEVATSPALSTAWQTWRCTATRLTAQSSRLTHETELRKQAAACLSRANLSRALEERLAEQQEERRQLSQVDKVHGWEQRALARKLMMPEWTAMAAAAKARERAVAPKRNFEDTPKHFFANSAKMNNERGAKCQGQGKRHQNAAVHAAPKAGAGRCAKWSSAKKKRSKSKKK